VSAEHDVLAELSAAGVSIWLDDLSRERINSGSLARLLAEDHVVGVTTNPTIFEKAIVGGEEYDGQLRDLAVRGVDVGEAVRALTTWDVRAACDILRPVWERTDKRDGRVSIEVDPRLAHESERTVAEARALWWMVDRPNLFIKIPATREGIPAITAALSEGISINVTLIFSLERYAAVLDAFMTGLEQRLERGESIEGMESVASFFVSRVDTEVDHRLDAIAAGGDAERADAARRLRGAAAIANARLAYAWFEEVLGTERWAALAAKGAHTQRPLWASTGVKDPAYEDTRYVIDLVAPDTVNTMPEATLRAVREHGVFRGDTVRGSYEDARATLDDLARVGVDLADVTDQLEREGVEKFEASWTDLVESVSGQLQGAAA
jgi:transaldolase